MYDDRIEYCDSCASLSDLDNNPDAHTLISLIFTCMQWLRHHCVEMLDLDAEGELDVDVDVDNHILMGWGECIMWATYYRV